MLVKVSRQVFHQAKNKPHTALEGTISTGPKNVARQYHWHTMPMCAHRNPEVSPQQTVLSQMDQTEAQMFCYYQR